MSSNEPLTPSKRRSASGRLGVRSPKKNKIDDVMNVDIVKLTSPPKRSMNELNRLAVQLAFEKRNTNDDILYDQERSLADKIIEQSKLEPTLKPFGLEIDLEYPEDLYSENVVNTEPTKKRRRTKKPLVADFANAKNSDTPTKNIKDIDFGSPVRARTPTKSSSPSNLPSRGPSPIKTKRISALSPLKSDNQYTPFVPTKDNRSLPLRSSNLTDKLNLAAKQELSSVPPSENGSPLATPRRLNRKYDASKVFSHLEDIKPRNHKLIKLMQVPEYDDQNDLLLITDKESKKQSLYLNGFEGYFEQNKLRSRPSANTMAMAPYISYDEYHKYNMILDGLCSKPIDSLNYFYERQAAQWLFEIQEGFNLAFYGVGSKRDLINKFVQRIILPRVQNTRCLVINGYNPEFHPRLLLKEIWQRCFKKTAPASRELLDLLNNTIQEFSNARRSHKHKDLILLIHNIDGEALRVDKYHYIFSEMAKLSKVTIICTMDNVNTPLFWDTSAMNNFNFTWHNISTFVSYRTEVTFRDPLSLGKSDEFVGSKGAKYVLSSLTANAKNLYKTLLIQQLEKIDLAITEDEKLMETRGALQGSIKTCISFREFYDQCVAEFITSNEISFRAVLGEFVEHKMCRLTRDRSGADVLYIPFSVDEMEKLLEEELLE